MIKERSTRSINPSISSGNGVRVVPFGYQLDAPGLRLIRIGVREVDRIRHTDKD